MKKVIAAVISVILLVSAFPLGVFADESGEGGEPVNIIKYLDIVNPSVSRSEVLAGESFNISFTVSPVGIFATQISLSISGNGFSLDSQLATVNGMAGYNTLTIVSDDTLDSGRYPLTVRAECRDFSSGETYVAEYSFNIKVEASQVILDNETSDGINFTLVSASIPEGKGKSELSTKLEVSLKNSSGITARDVKLVIENLGDIVLNTYTDTIEIGTVPGGETVSGSFPIKFPEFPKAQSTVLVSVRYKDSLGAEHSESFNVYLQAREKAKDEELSDTASLTPKVIVSNYTTDLEKINSGDEFELTFVLKNTSQDKDVKNMTVNVVPGTDGSANSTSGTIFSPIDGTTSFYTEVLPKDGELEYKIRLKTSASAGARSYPITISFDFEYENGASYSNGNGSMDINLPVFQPIKFELMEWYPPTECSVDGTMISFQYFNKSKNPMTNLSISVEGDFVMSTQYVGTLNASSYDFFSGTITPADPTAIGETKTGVLVFTFEDASYNEQRVEYPIEAVITESSMGGIVEDPSIGGGMDVGIDMPVYDDVIGGEVGEETSGGFLSGLPQAARLSIFIGVPALVVIIAAVVIATAIRKKKAKLYDDDEDYE